MCGTLDQERTEEKKEVDSSTVHFLVRLYIYNMPHTPRCKCVDCERGLDLNQLREVGAGLLRLFLAVKWSKRIRCDDMICQKCRSQFLKWQQKMEGDFDNYDNVAELDMKSMNIDDDSVRNNILLCF